MENLFDTWEKHTEEPEGVDEQQYKVVTDEPELVL